MSIAINSTGPLSAFAADFQGVTVTRNEGPNACVTDYSTCQCLLTICATEAPGVVFTNTTIRAVNLYDPSSDCYGQQLLCIVRESNTSWTAFEAFGNNHTVLYVKDSSIVRMEGTLSNLTGGAALSSLVLSPETSTPIRFLHNNCPAFGGILTVEGNAALHLSGGVLVKDNTNRGVSISNNGSAFFSRGVTFDSNTAVVGDGAGLAATGNSSVLLSDGVAFINNQVVGDGAGLAATGNGSVLLSDGVAFINNQADTDRNRGDWEPHGSGGGLAVRDNSSVTLRNGVLFSGNVAVRRNGGALYATDYASVVVQNGVLFTGNEAKSGLGGALYADANVTIKIFDGVKFDYNSAAAGAGGGIAVVARAIVDISRDVTVSRNVVGAVGFQGSENWIGGGLVAKGESRVIIRNGTVFSGNAVFGLSGRGAGLTAHDSAIVTMSGARFAGNVATGIDSCGGGFALLGNATIDVTGDVTVEGNIASAGGGICVNGEDNATMSLAGITLTGNQAVGSGGGLMLKGPASVIINGGSVIQNSTSRLAGAGLAVVGGGARLGLIGVTIRWNYVAGALGGGLHVDSGAEALLESVVFTDNAAASPASADIYGGPESKLTFDSTKKGFNNSVDMFSDSVLWLRQNCSRGQHFKAGYCQPCQPRTYILDYIEFNSRAHECRSCPPRASCPGGDKLVPINDTWHSTIDSTQMHICPRKGVCFTAKDGDKGECMDGYYGNVCGACEPGFGSHGPFKCKMCMSSVGQSIALYLCAALAVLLFLSFQVQTILNDNKERSVAMSGAGPASHYGENDAVSTGARPSDFLRILVRHVQYLCILSTLNLQWPRTLSAVFVGVNWLMSFGSPTSEALSVDCLFTQPSEGGTEDGMVPMVIKRTIIYMLAPLAFFVVVVAARLLVKALCNSSSSGSCVKLNHSSEEGADSILERPEAVPSVVVARNQSVVCVAFLVVLIFFYPSLVQGAVGMFACLRLDGHNPDDPGSDQYAIANATHGYWVYYIQQPCLEGWHRAWALGLGIPCTILFCIAVPLGIFLLLFTNRSKLGVPGKFQECVGFLYHNYRPSRYWWEVVILVQIQLLVTISVFVYSLTAYFTTLLLQASFGILLALQHWFRPSMVNSINYMSMQSLGVLVFTSTVALTFFTFEVAAPGWYAEVIGVVCVLLNFGFIIWCSYNVAKHSSKMVAQWGAAAHTAWQEYSGNLRGSTTNTDEAKDPAAV
jgi:predicted outer membrane repeat protein